MSRLVIRGAIVVDADGERPADVRIEGGRIVEVGDVHGATDEPVIAANGRYLTPGLVDCHIHLCYDGGPTPRVMTEKTDAQLAMEAAEDARRTLLAGVTTARDCGGRGFVAEGVRASIAAGTLEGPRLLTTGHPIVRKGGHMSYYGYETSGVQDCRRGARAQLEGGAEWLKVVATGGITTPNVDPRKAELTEEDIRAVVEEAARSGKHVAAHAHGGDGIRNALNGGVRSVEHGTFVDDAMIRKMVADGTFLVPTLVATRAMIDAGTAKGVPAYAVEKAGQIDGERRKAFGECVRKGVRVAMGTDAGTPFNPHGGNAREVMLMVEAGMTPKQALHASTVQGAELLGLGDRIGRVQEGFIGDLLVLLKNPIDWPDAFQLPMAVIRAGAVVHRAPETVSAPLGGIEVGDTDHR